MSRFVPPPIDVKVRCRLMLGLDPVTAWVDADLGPEKQTDVCWPNCTLQADGIEVQGDGIGGLIAFPGLMSTYYGNFTVIFNPLDLADMGFRRLLASVHVTFGKDPYHANDQEAAP